MANVLRDSRADIVCPKESKLTSPSRSIMNQLEPRSSFEFCVMNTRGASCGIMIGMGINKYEIICKEEGRFTLSVIVKRRMDNWRQVVNAVYGSNHTKLRKDCWEE